MRLPLLVIVASLLLMSGLSACEPAASAPATSPPPPVTGSTIGQLAQAGETVFARRCAQCHGSSGQGAVAPAVIGQKANLDKYRNSNELLKVLSTRMPKNAPGQLSQEEYAQVLSYLLIQNSFVSEGTAFAADELAQIDLDR